MDIEATFHRWLEKADASLQAELAAMDADGRSDAFYRHLAFGTGGLRGIIGAGTNRMNVHTVRRASQGLADYINARWPAHLRRVAVSRDSRIMSEEFAMAAAGVFAANGIQVMLFPKLMPTPCLSFAVRALQCAAGVMITASHNPARYNGFKVYGADGCQITSQAAEDIQAAIDRLDMFDDIRWLPFEDGLLSGRIGWIPPRTVTAYAETVKAQSLLGGEPADKSAAIAYTPLNGAGLKPVLRVLRESGYDNVQVVPAQQAPDGRFPTCPSPNPECPEAMAEGIAFARGIGAGLLLATDPDCDRCGIAVRKPDGDYARLSGNEIGMLLLDYICQRRVALGTMPKYPLVIKSIVTTAMIERIAARYDVAVQNVLTGFKYIGEILGRLEKRGQSDRFILGLEESLGYLTGSYVRDKDGVDAALMICDMHAWYAARGLELWTRLGQLYDEYGFCLDTQRSYTFDGAAGSDRMQRIMNTLRNGLRTLGDRRVVRVEDYAHGIDDLPKSNVLRFSLADGATVVVRPSGTEPKLKLYFSVPAPSRAAAEAVTELLRRSLEAYMR